MTRIKIICEPDNLLAGEIRALFCQEAISKPKEGYNPLVSTRFNALLDSITQAAFEEGLNFKYPPNK